MFRISTYVFRVVIAVSLTSLAIYIGASHGLVNFASAVATALALFRLVYARVGTLGLCAVLRRFLIDGPNWIDVLLAGVAMDIGGFHAKHGGYTAIPWA